MEQKKSYYIFIGTTLFFVVASVNIFILTNLNSYLTREDWRQIITGMKIFLGVSGIMFFTCIIMGCTALMIYCAGWFLNMANTKANAKINNKNAFPALPNQFQLQGNETEETEESQGLSYNPKIKVIGEE